MSSVRFQGIVFLPTEQQCDQFGQILQNIANKVLEVFNGCQNKSLSYEHKAKLIQNLWSVETELPVLVELDTIIATVYDNENPSKPVLESKVAEIKKLVDSLKPSFQLLKSKDAKEISVEDHKIFFDGLISVLRIHSELLQTQNQYKINAIIGAASVLSIKSYREALRQNKPTQDNPVVARFVTPTAQCLDELVSRAEERVPIIEALAADYHGKHPKHLRITPKDEVHTEPPPQLLNSSIDHLRSVLSGKLLDLKSHKPANKEKSQPETALLELPCVLEDFEYDKIKTIMAQKKGNSISIDRVPSLSDSVENLLEKVVKDIAAILYVVQIPLDIFTSCFAFEDFPEVETKVIVDESEESKLEKISSELEKVLALISEKKPKEAVGIVSNVLKAIKAGLETANPQYKQLYNKLQEQAPLLVKYTKEAFQHNESNNASGYKTAQGRLIIIVTDIKSGISSARLAPQDSMFDLMEAGGLVAKALAGLLSASDSISQ